MLLAVLGCTVGLGLSAAACGGASYSAEVPGTSLGEAEKDVDAAEARLGAVLGRNEQALKRPGEDGGVPSQQPVGPPQPPVHPTAEPGRPAETPLQEEDRCKTACDALTSMLRAVDRLCNLTGQGEDRCQNARARVNRASERVTEVCPACTTT